MASVLVGMASVLVGMVFVLVGMVLVPNEREFILVVFGLWLAWWLLFLCRHSLSIRKNW